MKKQGVSGTIKAGVIGYGGSYNMGKAHLLEMQKAGIVPTAVAEINPERLKVAAADFPGIETYASVDKLLNHSDVNVLAIITPHNTHARLALRCLNAGRHVVCEKPLAITTAECDAMIAAARKNRVVLSTYHNRHWDGCILQAVKTIRSGVIGEVVSVETFTGGRGQPRNWWRSSKSISGGILYDWGVHMLEYTLQIIDAKIVEVSGFAHTGFWAPQSSWKKDTNEDEAFALIRYANGAWSSLLSSSINSRPKPHWMVIAGTLGAYLMGAGGWELITHDGAKTITTHGPNPPSEGWRLYQNVADHLRKGAKLIITPEWARRPIHILDLACQSAKQGCALKAKYG